MTARWSAVGGWESWPDAFPEPLTVELVREEPPRCRCSHRQHPRGQCWSAACGCRENRPDVPDVQDAMDRHPAGKDIEQPGGAA